MKREIIKKPLSWFKTVKNVRQDYGEAELLELGKSQLKRQLYPACARPDGTLIDGHRRHAAAELVGKPDLDVIIIDEDLTPSEITALQIVSATQCKKLTGHELYLGVYEILQCNPGKPLKEIAEMVSMDPSMVTRILAASKLDAKGMQAFADGKLTTSDVYLITQPDNEAERLALLEAKLSGSIGSRDAMRREVRARKLPAANSKKSEIKRFRATLPWSAVDITLSGQSLELNEVIKALTELLKLARNAKKQRLGVAEFEGSLRDQKDGEAA